MIVELPLTSLIPTQRNTRKTFYGIEELAESIGQIKLLQNLVVGNGQTIGGKVYYEVMAGERRHRALNLLVKQGRPYNQDPQTGISMVPCLITDEPFDWVNLSENINRHDVPIWQLGHRFCELMDSGYTQPQIAAKLQIPQPRVSRYSTIARNLCPEVTAMLEGTRGFPWKESDLMRMANLVDRHHSPDVKAQLALFNQLLEDPNSHSRKRRRPAGIKNDAVGTKQMVWARFERLKKGKSFKGTAEQQAWLQAMIRYLDGRDKYFRLE